MKLIHFFVGLAIALSALAVFLAGAPKEIPVGSGSGQEHFSYQSFLDGIYAVKLTTGGPIATLTDANGGTYTLTQAELENSNVLKFAAGGAGQAVIALTFPATSTMNNLIQKAGDCRTWLYDASDLAAATTTTLTAGTGHDVIAYTTNDDVIDGAEFSQITMCRQADGDVTTLVSELLNAD